MSSSADVRDRPLRPPLLHHDPLAGRMAFIAPERAERPNDADLVAVDAATDPGAWCPFCAGNEHRTPPAVLRAPAEASRSWHARIVPTRYPVAMEADPRDDAEGAVAPVRPAHGVHDVVVESARHESTILGVQPEEWRDVWHLCRARLERLAARGDLAWATIFKNSGPAAGASLAHVHSQLVGLDFVPPSIRAELAAAAADATGFARLIDDAVRSGRLVAEQAGLVALAPPAPRQPFETWILQLVAAPGALRRPRPTGRGMAVASRDPAPGHLPRRLRARHRLPHQHAPAGRGGRPAARCVSRVTRSCVAMRVGPGAGTAAAGLRRPAQAAGPSRALGKSEARAGVIGLARGPSSRTIASGRPRPASHLAAPRR